MKGRRWYKKFVKRRATPFVDVFTGEERPGFPNPTKGQMEKMAAIERNISKLAYDVGARGIYIAKPEKFHGTMIGHLIALFKPFTSEGWNGINSYAWMKKFDDYPWEIGVEKIKEKFRRKLVEQYRRRQFFYDPFFKGRIVYARRDGDEHRGACDNIPYSFECHPNTRFESYPIGNERSPCEFANLMHGF